MFFHITDLQLSNNGSVGNFLIPLIFAQGFSYGTVYICFFAGYCLFRLFREVERVESPLVSGRQGGPYFFLKNHGDVLDLPPTQDAIVANELRFFLP